MSRAYSLRTATLIPCTVFLLGCPLLPATPAAAKAAVAASVIVVQGNQQTAQAGRALPSTIVLRAVDENGHGVSKQVTTFVVATGGGVVSPGSAVSDSSGEMKVTWTLGTATAVQQLLASLTGDVGVSVKATAVFPTSIVVVQGADQSVKIGTALKNDIVVRVIGTSNQPMIGIPVTFSVSSGGGAITPQSGVTNAQGEFSTKWTLGAAAGANALKVESGTLTPTTIAATATP